MGGGALLRDRGDSRATGFRPPDLGALSGGPRRRRLLHCRRHHSTELAVVLRCAGPPGVGERGAFQGQPLASRASGHPDPDDRTGDVAQAAGSLGIATPEGGRSLRRDPDLRSSFQRLATSGARLLLERAAFKAGRCRADRLPDTFLGYGGATVAGGTRAGRAPTSRSFAPSTRRKTRSPTRSGWTACSAR